MQVKELFKQSIQRLNDAGIPSAELEVTLLLSHQLGIHAVEIYLADDRILNGDSMKSFEGLLRRRINREPLAYILGKKEFWSLDFKVTSDVLIPRPETEFLVETILQVVKKTGNMLGREIRVLDLGTGSGVLAIVIALEIPTANVLAIDYSAEALQIAKHNARQHRVINRVNFLNSDWLAAVKRKEMFDLVVSNPPYVSRETLDKPFGKTPDGLEPEVGIYEPKLALDGGIKGLQSIYRISGKLLTALRPGGWFFMEIGAEQGRAVESHFRSIGGFDSIKVYNDYAGLPRVFQARKED
jgi:release factor glutamine methyltransferase